jgi:hypothetical protein
MALGSQTAGSIINPGAIGSAAAVLPGFILLDNTFGCTPAGCTPVTGFINATDANLSLATTSTGVTINAAIYANGNITAKGASGSLYGIDYSVAIFSKNGDVSLNGGSLANRAVYNSVASTITANNSKTFTYLYDKLGRRDTISYPNNITVKHGYDNLNRLTLIRHTTPTTTIRTGTRKFIGTA